MFREKFRAGVRGRELTVSSPPPLSLLFRSAILPGMDAGDGAAAGAAVGAFSGGEFPRGNVVADVFRRQAVSIVP